MRSAITLTTAHPRRPRGDAIFSGKSLLEELFRACSKLSPFAKNRLLENLALSRLAVPGSPKIIPAREYGITGLFTDATLFRFFIQTKKISRSARFLMPNVVNLRSFIGIRFKLINDTGPSNNFYNEMYAREGSACFVTNICKSMASHIFMNFQRFFL